MTDLLVRGGKKLSGAVTVPGDKSISHRAIIFSALAEGDSELRGLGEGADNRSTAAAFQMMGVSIELGEPTRVVGRGLDALKMPTSSIDCGNSGTTMRLLAGLLAGQRFGARLIGDDSLTRRPMRRVVEPLRARGAQIAGTVGAKEDEVYPPISIAPLVDAETLGPLEYSSPIASAQVKSALLLSGLYAKGVTAVQEPVVSRDHTERMMVSLGVPLSALGPAVVLDPSGWDRRWSGFSWDIPGDISSAAFLVAASATVPGSDVVIRSVGLNPTRTGFLDVMRSMRADVAITPQGDAAGGEPVGEIRVCCGRLVGAQTGGELLTRMIDEVPIFAAVAAAASGQSDVADARELRFKESDRLSACAAMLRAFGVDHTELDDGLHIHGGELRPAEVDSHGDHRIAMSATIMALRATGLSRVRNVACIQTSFPGFVETLRRLGADIEEVE